jgi:uncharacterized membrane protein (UPF0127 family)
MKYLRLVFIGAVIGFGITGLLKLYSNTTPGCSAQYRHDATITIGSNTLNAQVSSTSHQLQTGLSGRSCIKSDDAMLFVFDKPGYYPFWMKDMKFPIDIIWINENKTVNQVKSSVSPNTYPNTFVNTQPAKYVLEVKAGTTLQLNINEGTSLSF